MKTHQKKKRASVQDLVDVLDNREYAYMEMALLELEKARCARLRQNLHAALSHIGSYGDDSSYYFKRGLETTIAHEQQEYEQKVAERRKLYEDGKLKA